MSIETEQAVLGGLLDGADVPPIRAEHFADGVHQELFAELVRRAESEIPRDAVSMRQWWEARPYAAELDADGPYLADLQRDAPPLESVNAYAVQVKAAYDRRALAQIGKEMTGQCEAGDDPSAIIEAAERDLAGLAETTTTRKTVSAGMALQTAMRERGQGIETGWRDMDESFMGWRSGRLYIAAGRPGMGKSLFGAACALEVAKRGKPVAFVSLEMSAEEVSVRLAAALSGIPYSSIERDGIWPDNQHKFDRASDTLDCLPFTILDMPGASVGAIRNAIRRLNSDMHRRSGQGLAFVCVDYLGLVSAPEPGMKLYEATTRNSQAFKQMSRELGLPVMVLAQLSRAVEQRNDKRPMLADLRDSGAIEQDADAVFGLYRDAYYARQEEPDCHPSEPEFLEWQERKNSREFEVCILKQRGGQTGPVTLYCDPATGIIRDYRQEDAA